MREGKALAQDMDVFGVLDQRCRVSCFRNEHKIPAWRPTNYKRGKTFLSKYKCSNS